MSTPYSAIEPYVQGSIEAGLGTVNFPEECELLTEVVSPGDQAKNFRRRLPDADPEKLKWAIITYWEGSGWHEKLFNADEAIYWLQIYGLLSAEQRVTSPENFMRLYADSERVKAAGLAVSRSDPFQPVSQGRGV
jgi:hypothetical protein